MNVFSDHIRMIYLYFVSKRPKMKTNFKITTIVYLIGILLFFNINCNKSKLNKAIDPGFIGYITAFTSGVISNQSTIKIRLTEPFSGAMVGKEVDKELFDFSPNIEGNSYWIDDQTIEFRPDKPMPSGKIYDGEFYLSKLVEVPSKFKTFNFNFQILKQNVNIEFAGNETYDNQNKKIQALGLDISTSDYIDNISLEKAVKAYQNGKELSITWDHNENTKNHSIRIDSIRRDNSEGRVLLKVDKGIAGLEKDIDKEIKIAPVRKFEVTDIKVIQQPTQEVVVFFSDPLDENQDLTGLIYFEPQTQINIIKETNSVRITLNSRLETTVKLIANTGIKNSEGENLSAQFERDITFENLNPALALVGKGNILPSANGLNFLFKAVNIKEVNVKILKIYENNVSQFLQVNQLDGTQEMKRVARIVYKGKLALKSEKPVDFGAWNVFGIDLSKMIETEPGAIYRIHLSFTQKQSIYPCDSTSSEDITALEEEDNDDSSFDDPGSGWYYYDDNEYYYDDEYNYEERNDPCKPSFYQGSSHAIANNILASDLGIIAKGGYGSTMLVAVADINNTNPISGVEVEFYNFQRQLIDTKTTDGDGFVTIDLKNKPFLLVAKKGKQRGYLRLDDGSSLSLSMFDIGGQQNVEGVKGFIYGERGVWRPGDSIYLSFMLEDKNAVLPKDHPVVFELYTPQQQLYTRKIKTNSLNNLFDFRTATADYAPTGNWNAVVKIGGSVFSKTVRIEAIKPNRLKINLDFHNTILNSKSIKKADLDVKWLHGAIAENLKTDVEVNLLKGSSQFENYKDYVFDDPSKTFTSEPKIIFDGQLDKNGHTSFIPKFEIGDEAPGMLQAYFKVRTFEKGGDFSMDRFIIPYSPYDEYVGLKIPKGKGWNGALYSNEPNLIPIATLNEFGKPVDRKGLKIEIYDVYWRWWWERSEEDDLSQYVADKSKNLIKSATIDTKNGKALYEMNLGDRYYGRKFIKITDPSSGHSCGATFYVTYKGWYNDYTGENPGGAEMLTFSSDKTSYNVGENVKVIIPNAKQGRSLVSLESGSKIVKAFWVDMKDGDNTFTFKATDDMAPNIYIHLSLIQPYYNVKNDLPIRLYGVQAIKVENPLSHLEPIITMPAEITPDKQFNVKVSEKNGQKMTYTLAIVDEGLLDLTKYKTPDPWNEFFAKEALSVKTWDMYKYIIGAFSGEIAGLLALGGDEYLGKGSAPKANRFKPVVKFLGPFEIGKNGSKSHTIEINNYVGSVRTMVVACQDNAYGSAEKTTPVKKPLMVMSTLPRVVGPGENIELPVNVFAMDKKIQNVNVTVESNSLLALSDNKNKSISFKREGDQIVDFKLKSGTKLGIAKVKIIAKSGNEIAIENIELDVRASNPKITNVVDVVLEPGKSWSGEYKAIGLDGTNNGTAEVSSIPPLKLMDRLNYLITYPHGCIEQTTSSVFPQLFLADVLQLSEADKKKVEGNIKAGIERLKSFQISTGGLSYWPGEHDMASDWGTNYAGHFMLEAKVKGYDLPHGFMEKWTKFQKQRANNWTQDMEDYGENNDLIQAYRLYTLALANTPEMGAMNRMMGMKKLSLAAKWRLAAAYALTGKKNVALNLIAKQPISVPDYTEYSYSYGCDERDDAMILETLLLLNMKKEAKTLFDDLSRNLSSANWYSTQTTAYSLLAVAKFVGDSGNNPVNFEIAMNGGQKQKINSNAPIYQYDLDFKNRNSGKIEVINTGKKTIFVKIQTEGIPLNGDKTNAENNLKMSVAYQNLEGKPIDPGTLKQGTDFAAIITVTHPGLLRDYKEMAITEIFPSGWEIRNMRLDNLDINKSFDVPRYQDIRDDRVLTYFDLPRSTTKRFKVILNAAYLGDYYLPTVYCEAMYDNKINARKAGKWIKVIR